MPVSFEHPRGSRDKAQDPNIFSFDSARRLRLQLTQRVIVLTEYIEAAMGKARYEILSDDNTFYGHIRGA